MANYEEILKMPPLDVQLILDTIGELSERERTITKELDKIKVMKDCYTSIFTALYENHGGTA